MLKDLVEHPRDRFITVYGRKPVLEALYNEDIVVDKVLVAANAQGEFLDEILKMAARRGIKVARESQKYITRISRNGRHDQGVVADIVAPAMEPLSTYLEQDRINTRNCKHRPRSLLALDGVKNPSNVGMIIRTCLASGFDGIVLPRRGCPDITPLVIKASAGTALKTRILRCSDLAEALYQLNIAGYTVYGLSATAKQALYEASFAPLSVFVLGNESTGINMDTKELIKHWISIPINTAAESLNVACAAAVVCFELKRRS
jgi:23S rRNA (guanosine2251-2'-O)-methyltransferase